jgi:hypothetical protein
MNPPSNFRHSLSLLLNAFTMKNIQFDFTTNKAVEDQPLALMPAGIAKMALQLLARSLSGATPYAIISQLIDELKDARDNRKVQEAEQIALNFINTRSLIANILKENWDAYRIPEEEAVDENIL